MVCSVALLGSYNEKQQEGRCSVQWAGVKCGVDYIGGKIVAGLLDGS